MVIANLSAQRPFAMTSIKVGPAKRRPGAAGVKRSGQNMLRCNLPPGLRVISVVIVNGYNLTDCARTLASFNP